jgi:STE24 endopeptidase
VVAEVAARLLRPRDRPVPVDVAARDYFSDAELEKARRFRRGQLRLRAARTVLELAALTALVRRPPAPLLRAPRPVLGGAAAAAAMSAGGTILTLPIAAAARRRADKVGLVTQGWGGWAVDLAKGLAIESVLAAGGGALLVAGARRFGRLWWLPGSGAAIAFSILGSTIAPVLLDPIFNRYTPLPDGELRRDVLGLASRAGVRVGEVFEVDASRRTTAANAYVAGLGPTKRVVFFDTLLRDFTPGEVRFVVAHELGHQRFRDVTRGLAYLAVVAPTGLLAVATLADALTPPGEEAGPALVPAVTLASSLFVPLLAPAANRLSRGLEVRADRFAIEMTHDASTLIEFHRRITLSNVADPHPPKWVRALFGTHPSTVERIGHALAAERA